LGASFRERAFLRNPRGVRTLNERSNHRALKTRVKCPMNITRLSTKLFREHENAIHRRTDRIFAILMLLQYAAGIAAAIFVTPRSWQIVGHPGNAIRIAAFLGALILAPPIALAYCCPGRRFTRHVIAIGQMLDAALLIHLSGGRIETHFHIFGSLAFLGFYRDWKVLATASIVVAIDHYYRGTYWPYSVYGVVIAEPRRWLEHMAWILFEDIFIVLASRQSLREMHEIALRRAYVEQVAVERGRDIQTLEDTKRQLRIALESKNEFLSICGHELKTPLTALHLQAQVARRLLTQGPARIAPEKLWVLTRKFIEQSEAQVMRLLRLVQDLLDHSRIQMGKLSIFPELVDVAALIREVVERYRLDAEHAGSRLALRIQEGVTATWDRFRIEQVITNLVSNAIKYGAGKPIEVDFKVGDHGNAQIVVRDHGIGIDDSDQERVFRQFERVQPKEFIPGLGLGLYISRGIVESHGGVLRCQSRVGEGSAFILDLPLRVASSLDAEPSPQLA
jgi:signal transduction histidine kinase